MTVKQLSVFIENRQGRLGEVLKVLKENGVSILSFSLSDTTEYGILRIIVNDPVRGCDVLVREGFSSMLTDVLIIKLPHVAGALQSILERIAEKKVNIEYAYGLTVGTDDASIVVKANDLDAACDVFKHEQIKTMSAAEIASL
ncbi:MAG: amino acid-binding protein [Ruminococcaceae bacterium]|nr:amino acid-binding protein [Oscillospiraceae bacterium]